MTKAKYEQLKEMFGKYYANLARRCVRFGNHRDLREYLKLRKHVIRVGGGESRAGVVAGHRFGSKH